jgi:hypothetical protein
MRMIVSAFTIAALSATALSAGPPKSDDNSPTPIWTFRVTPVGESKPALRWHLLPELREQHPGDAAATYLRAMSPEFMHPFNPESVTEAFASMNDWSIADLRTDKAKTLRTVIASSALTEADRAARCDSCDWHLHQRQREDGIRLQLPELQSMRILSRGLFARTRFEIADGDFPAALRSLQTQFAAGRHIGGDSSNLIQSLVGIAVAGQAVRAAADWIEAPNSPNLYWGLTALPSPYIPVRRGMEGERIFMDVMFPGYRDSLLSKSPPPPLDIEKTKAALDSIGVESSPFVGPFIIAAQAELARKHLFADGWKPEVVKSMPVTTAVFLYEIAVYDEFLDAALKWMAAPSSVAVAGLADAEAKFVKHARSSDRTILARLLLPAVQSAYFAQLRLDRQIAGLRCVEAIRLHAAAAGKLPTSSAEINVVPWPNDPATGKPFAITAEGDAVKIVAAVPAGQTHGHAGFQFLVSLAKR